MSCLSLRRPRAREDGLGEAGEAAGGRVQPSPAHLLLLEDDLVEKVLKVLVRIVDAQLLETVEAQVL